MPAEPNRYVTFYMHHTHIRKLETAARKLKMNRSHFIRDAVLRKMGLDVSEDYRHHKLVTRKTAR